MPEFLFSLRFWMAGCFLFGAAVGAATRSRPARGGVSPWLSWMGAAGLAGATALLLGAVKGPAAVYLATGLVFCLAYLPGAAVGAIVAGGGLRNHESWAVGLAPLAVICWAAIAAGPAQTRSQTPPAEAGGAGPAEAPGAGVAPEPPSAAVSGREAAKGETGLAETPEQVCLRRLSAIGGTGEMTFARGKSAISRKMAVALDAAAIAIRDCAVDAIEVVAGGDDGGTDPAGRLLAQKRAAAVVLYLRREGLGGRTVRPGDAGGNGPAGNGSISFVVR